MNKHIIFAPVEYQHILDLFADRRERYQFGDTVKLYTYVYELSDEELTYIKLSVPVIFIEPPPFDKPYVKLP